MHRPLGSEEPRHVRGYPTPRRSHRTRACPPTLRRERNKHNLPGSPRSTESTGILGSPTTARPTDAEPDTKTGTRSLPRPPAPPGDLPPGLWQAREWLPVIRRCPVPSDQVEQTKQVKAASDIVAVVGSYLTIKPAGKIFKALCPFHNDSRPSLDIDPSRQRYKCWSCGAHGDVFAFVQHMEKVGFKEARQILATRVGIKLDERELSPQDHHRAKLLDVMKWAQAKYAHQLLEDSAGEAARKYLGERKLAGKTVRDFGLGFASLKGDWLARVAAAEHIPDELLVEVGLIAPSQAGRGYYDRFRDRVMFPIKDVRGQVVGFGGRIMPNSPYASRAPKYYNSAETPLFSKSELLYGLDVARHGGASAGFLAVVEGYTDVMMAHQCGMTQVVATMGTALNAKHVAQ